MRPTPWRSSRPTDKRNLPQAARHVLLSGVLRGVPGAALDGGRAKMFARFLSGTLLVGVLTGLLPARSVEGFGTNDRRTPTLTARVRDEVAAMPQGPARAPAAMSDEEVQRIGHALGAMRPKGGHTPEPGQLVLTLEESIQLTLQKNPSIQIAQLTRDARRPEVARAEALFHPVAGGTLAGSRTGEKDVGFKKDDELIDGQRVADEGARKPTAFISQTVPTGATLLVSGDMRRRETAGGSEPTARLAVRNCPRILSRHSKRARMRRPSSGR